MRGLIGSAVLAWFLAQAGDARAQAFEFTRENNASLSWGRQGFKPINPKKESQLAIASAEIDLDLRRPRVVATFDLGAADPAHFLCDIGISEELYSVPRQPSHPQVVIVGRQPQKPPRRFEIVARELRVGEQAHIAFSTGSGRSELVAGLVVNAKERRRKITITLEPVFSIADPPDSIPLTVQGVGKARMQLERAKRGLDRFADAASVEPSQRQYLEEARTQREVIRRQLTLIASVGEYAKSIHDNGSIYVRGYVGNATLSCDVR